jgi:hypothetical protein
LIPEYRNKTMLPSCATDVTSISRSSVLPPEYLQALSNEQCAGGHRACRRHVLPGEETHRPTRRECAAASRGPSPIEATAASQRKAASIGGEIAILENVGAGEGNRTLVFSLEGSEISQCFQEPFRHFAAFWPIEIPTEFLFVGMATTTEARGTNNLGNRRRAI